MSQEDLPLHEEKDAIDLENELELLIYTYGGRHFHGCLHFPCGGTCEQAILAKEILRLRSNIEDDKPKHELAPEFVVLDENVELISVSLVDRPLDPSWKIIHPKPPNDYKSDSIDGR